VAFRTRTVPTGPKVVQMTDDRFRQVATTQRWTVLTAPRADPRGRPCPTSSRYAPRVPAKRCPPPRPGRPQCIETPDLRVTG
jgi:hypothetical protein